MKHLAELHRSLWGSLELDWLLSNSPIFSQRYSQATLAHTALGKDFVFYIFLHLFAKIFIHLLVCYVQILKGLYQKRGTYMCITDTHVSFGSNLV